MAKPCPITLELPTEEFIDNFFEAMAEFAQDGNPQVARDLTKAQFPAYVQSLHDLAAGRNLKPGYIPSKEFWIIDPDGYAGRIILGLTTIKLGHHVGYAIRPSKRKRGYATKALELLIEEARQLNILKLMPECDSSTVGSCKVIERNGGILLDRLPNGEPAQGSLMYLIDLTREKD